MLKRLLLVGSLLFSTSFFAQCPTTAITLNSQADVDAFFTSYPGCTELQNTLTISGADIVDLAPLNGILSVTGPSVSGLDISANPLLTNLDGLETLETVGRLFITDNDLLENLDGLSGLTSIDSPFVSTLSIQNNPALTSIEGLSSFSLRAEDSLIIANNDALTDLNGLREIENAAGIIIADNQVLSSIANLQRIFTVGNLIIDNNPNLQTFGDLFRLSSLGNLEITDNPNLDDISGLGGAFLDTDATLTITGNTSLSVCDADTLCSFLFTDDPAATVLIENNLPGCNTPAEISASCEDCPSEEISLSNQAEVDAYFSIYPNCTILASTINISGDDIDDLSPLSGIEELTRLRIFSNPLLENLDGLESITTLNSLAVFSNMILENIQGLSSLSGSVPSSFIISSNPALVNLQGLENITDAGGADVLYIFNNDLLVDLTGLNGLTFGSEFVIEGNDNMINLNGLDSYLSGSIIIRNNASLESLDGMPSLTHLNSIDLLDNPSLTDISGLGEEIFAPDDISVNAFITGNTSLEICNVSALCRLLTLPPSSSLFVENNAPGCNTVAEVEAACAACPTEDVFLTSQAEVDSFFVTSSGCTDLPFALSISGPDIVDLTPLNGLNSVLSLVIADNPLLTNLDGLESLVTISPTGFGLQIINNALLEDITGLSGVNGIVGDFIDIQNNPSLLSLDGLQNIIQPVNFDIFVINNDALTNLEGLNGMITADDLIVSDNDSLLTLEGLDDFVFTGTLEISNNALLQNTNGLTGLETIFGLIINNNPQLTDISGFTAGAFDEFAIGLSITNNPNLDICNALLICDYLAVARDSDVIIENNAPGCDSREEVEDSCAVCPTGDVVLTSQAQVDAFATDFPFCDTLISNLSITGSDITDLSGLNQIEILRGGLEIRNNPNLTSLAGLGPVFLDNSGLYIEDNPLLADLGEFSGTAGFPGFIIVNNDQLVNLNGLEGITASFDLFVDENDALLSLDGLQNLAVIEDLISIRFNPLLTDITALGGFSGGMNAIQIVANNSLVDLQGLEGLTSLEDSMLILNNIGLESLSGLQNCINEFIEPLYGIQIVGNSSLTDVSALDGYNVNAIGGFELRNNTSLALCNNEFVCNYLNRIDDPSVNISGNAPGCDSEEEVIRACTICITSDVTLNSQAEVDAFRNDFRFCDTVDGVRLTISGPDITDLSALSQLTNFVNNGTLWIENNPNLTSLASLGPINFDDAGLVVSSNASLVSLGEFSGNTDEFGLTIFGNASLTDISGLSGITSTKELRIIGQNSLTNLEGLENLTTVIELIDISDNPVLADLTDLTGINGDYWELLIDNNDSLTDLSGLEGLTGLTSIELSITDNDNLVSFNGLQNFFNENGGGLSFDISDNASLTDISAINSLDADTVDILIIQDNPLLAVCENDFVCTYLDTSITIGVLISGNAPGCSTVEEVEEACGLSVDEFSVESVKFYPNPAMDLVTLDLPTGLELREVVILNLLGQEVVSSNEQSFDVSGLEAGVYFVQVETNAGTVLKRLIKR